MTSTSSSDGVEGFSMRRGDFAAAWAVSDDLVITVDTMPAHLAGALGVPVWTLLHADADWRWMEARVDSPWSPAMRLFRQEHAGEWGPVRAARELAELANAHVQQRSRPRRAERTGSAKGSARAQRWIGCASAYSRTRRGRSPADRQLDRGWGFESPDGR
jgi:hypothetical protein